MAASRFTERFNTLYDEYKAKTGKSSELAFADYLGLSRQSVHNYLCTEDKFPDGKTLVKICRKLHISADWLMGLTDDPARGTLRIFLRNGVVHRIKNNYRENARIEVIEYDPDDDDSLMYEKLFNEPAYKEYDGEVEYIRCEGIADLADRMEDEAGYVQISSGEEEYKFKKKEGDALIQFSTLQGIRDFLDIMNRPACSNTESAR